MSIEKQPREGTWTPAGHRIIVHLDKIEEKKGNIYLPEIEQERDQKAVTTGVLVAVGPLAWRDWFDGTPWAKAGDYVKIAQYSGYLYEKDGEFYRVVNDEDLIAVMKEG